MRVSAFALVLLVAVLATAQAATIARIAGYYEGTSLNLYNFGQATTATTAGGDAFETVYVLPGTITTGPDGGSRGEIQQLLCNLVACPEVFAAPGTSSLWRRWQALIGNVNNNATFTSTSTFTTTNNYSISTSWTYRRVTGISANSVLQTTANGGLNSTQAYVSGSSVYYFDFGLDSYPADNAVYLIQGGAAILKNTLTHFVKVYNIVPPSGATESPVRFSDIPADWLSNSNITTTDGKTYEYGFYSVAATAPPVAAASSVFPSVLVAFFALLAAFFAL